ncbi:MAG: periplasmic heavy metal sensor [Acidobacteriota bacterium]
MKTRKTAMILAAVFISGLFFSGGLAQERERGLAARARENLNRLRLLRMTEVLELSEGQTATIYPAASRIEKEKTEILKAINSGLRDLRTLLAGPEPDEAALSAAVKMIQEQRQSLQRKDQEFEELLEGVLSAVQKAKYLLFTVEFYRGVAEKVNRARAMAREKRCP